MKYRLSGHETFPCRYAWLPKAISVVEHSPKIFSNEDDAMVNLGVGKNMVRAIRFWAEVTSIICNHSSQGWAVTSFGKDLLGKNGYDPFLENVQTLWLLHWKLSTQYEEPLFGWDYLLNRLQDPEFTSSSMIRVFGQELQKEGRKFSNTTLEHHLNVFVHTYIPTGGPKGKIQEDNLDSPFVELELLRRIGDRETDEGSGKREPIYAFRFEQKPEISTELFIYCLADFFIRKHPSEHTLSLREIAIGQGGPGQIFKLPEPEIRERLELLKTQTRGLLEFEDSTSIQQVRRNGDLPLERLLSNVY